ncbi:hypothetical protein ACJMK2_019680, partial [Sinanodonta woodiana]
MPYLAESIAILSEIAEDEGRSSDLNLNTLQQEEDRRERRRKKIIRELFETEKTYLHHLDLINKHFEFPLRFNCLVPDNVHAKLFGNIEQLFQVNKKLLEYMEQMTIGAAFKYLGPFLKLYSMYANNYILASDTLQEYMQKSKDFADFIQSKEQLPELMGLRIDALLITPIQRIPRYKLLLEDLLQNTSPEHHDYQQLKEATRQISEIATHINEHVRQHENFQKMLSIQNSFDSSAPRILEPGREFVKEGMLKKISRRGGKGQERMFFLFSDMLMYGKPKFLDSGGSSYTCCCVLPLRHCQVETVLGSLQCSDGGGMFRITCKDESLLLYSADADEVKYWIETTEEAIRKLCLNRQTLRKPSSNKIPLRGKSVIRKQIKDKKLEPKKNVFHSGKKVGSHSGQDGLSPLQAQFKALSEIEISNCLSPRKKQKKSGNSTPSMPSTLTIDNEVPGIEENQNGISVAMEADGSEFQDNIPISINEQGTQQCSDDSFMQVTMFDLDASLDHLNNTFEGNLQQNYKDQHGRGLQRWRYADENCDPNDSTAKRKSCITHPFQRILESGRNIKSGVGGFMENVRSGNSR